MATDTTLTSVILNPWSTSTTPFTGSPADQLIIPYADLGFVASASDSYKSTAGDIFKIYVDGVRIYRTSDSLYAGGAEFLEDGDIDNSVLSGISAYWSHTTDTVWTVDTANQRVTIDTGEITGSTLYGSGGKNVTFTSGTTIIELRRSVQNQKSPSIDFSNASILTEQDLDNSAANVFHMAQEAIETAKNALPYSVGTGVYQAYQPGTTTNRRITQVAAPTANDDVVTKTYLEDTWLTSTDKTNSATVAGISSDVTTVATAPVPANLNTLVNHYDGTTAASGTTKNLALLNTVALRNSEVGLLGTSAMATASTGHLARLGVATVTEDMALLGTAAVVEDMDLLGTTDCIADMAILGTADVVTDMNVLGTADVVTDMNTLGTADVVADMNTLGHADVVTDMNLLAVPAVIDDMALLAVPAVITDMDLLGATGVIADMDAIGATGVIADIETVADNVAGVTSFASRYRVAATDPSTSLDEGDLYYNTGTNLVKYYNGSAWTSFGLTQAQTQTEANNAAVAMSIALG
jgi:hypothetical protein